MTIDPFSLRDETIVVTGGLGQLGRAYAQALHDAGACVAVIDQMPADDSILQEKFGDRVTSGRLIYHQCNVTDRADTHAVLTALQTRWGTPTALINNAALDSPPNAPIEENGPFENYPETSWDKVMDVNVKGVFLCCQVFGSAMAKAGRGSIVNVSSIYGLLSPNQSIYEYRRQRGETYFKPIGYAVSKSAIFNMTRYLATYWARDGVRVNTLVLAGVFNNQDPEFLTAYTAHIPIGRMANPQDYTGPVIFLCSPASIYMTGTALTVDGGWSAW